MNKEIIEKVLKENFNFIYSKGLNSRFEYNKVEKILESAISRTIELMEGEFKKKERELLDALKDANRYAKVSPEEVMIIYRERDTEWKKAFKHLQGWIDNENGSGKYFMSLGIDKLNQKIKEILKKMEAKG